MRNEGGIDPYRFNLPRFIIEIRFLNEQSTLLTWNLIKTSSLIFSKFEIYLYFNKFSFSKRKTFLITFAWE